MNRSSYCRCPGAPGLAEAVARRLAANGEGALGALEHRRFPDGESYLRLPDVKDAVVVVVGDLCQPNGKVLDALFLARTARDLGAREVVLLAPYLPYMRQDARFQPGEAVTSSVFAGLMNDSLRRAPDGGPAPASPRGAVRHLPDPRARALVGIAAGGVGERANAPAR